MTKSLCRALVILFTSAVLSACVVNPFSYTDGKGRTVDSTGVSFLSESTQEGGSITKKDGTVIEYSRTGGKQTKLLSVYGNIKGYEAIGAPVAAGTGTVLRNLVK